MGKILGDASGWGLSLCVHSWMPLSVPCRCPYLGQVLVKTIGLTADPGSTTSELCDLERW